MKMSTVVHRLQFSAATPILFIDKMRISVFAISYIRNRQLVLTCFKFRIPPSAHLCGIVFLSRKYLKYMVKRKHHKGELYKI